MTLLIVRQLSPSRLVQLRRKVQQPRFVACMLFSVNRWHLVTTSCNVRVSLKSDLRGGRLFDGRMCPQSILSQFLTLSPNVFCS